MPRVYKIDDAKWKELFKYNCDDLRFNFKQTYKANQPKHHARRAGKLIPNIKEIIENKQRDKEHRIKIQWEKWNVRFAISLSAALCSTFRPRVKQSAVTTVMEVIEYFSYALKITSNKCFIDLPRQEQQEFLNAATDQIGRLVYYYFTAYAASQLLEATSWDEAMKSHENVVKKFSTNQFYLVRCHSAGIIADRLLSICTSHSILHHALNDYTIDSCNTIPGKQRASIRKRIARLIDNIPPADLAYESAYFAVDNGSYQLMQQVQPQKTPPPASYQEPTHGCHRKAAYIAPSS